MDPKQYGSILLLKACKSGTLTTIKCLFEELGLSKDAINTDTILTSIARRNIGVVELLYQTNPGAFSKNLSCELVAAAHQGGLPMTKHFVEQFGAEISDFRHEGRNCIHAAVEGCQNETI